MSIWPNGRRFAFTVVDDTDWATVATVKPVYDLLQNLGLHTTKLVWMYRGDGAGINSGSTCEDPDYLDWVLGLQRRGFEIGLHNPSPCTSGRVIFQSALIRFKELFGSDGLIHCNHTGCLENIYWGDHRLTGWRRAVYRTLTHGRRSAISRGHVEGDPLFWGDLCRENVSYVRNFVFDGLNTMKLCPEMPYHDPAKPYVNFWFAGADGGNLAVFLRNFTEEAIDELVREKGLCIAYVHFGGGFVKDGKVHPEFRKRMEYLARQDGWFAPVSVILDHLRGEKTPLERSIDAGALQRLELRWLANKVATEGMKKVRPPRHATPASLWA